MANGVGLPWDSKRTTADDAACHFVILRIRIVIMPSSLVLRAPGLQTRSVAWNSTHNEPDYSD